MLSTRDILAGAESEHSGSGFGHPGPYAQTNVQLYTQLITAGYADGDLERVRAAYELATELFAAQYRPDGRPFVAHLVGVASILAADGASPTVVTAGLLHSAYTQGDFGRPNRRWSVHARRRVRAAVGEGVESLVARYATFGWNDAIRGDIRTTPVVAGPERDLLLIRLANTLDDYRELGGLCSAKSVSLRAAIGFCIETARSLGATRLADSLAGAQAEAARTTCPSVLRSQRSASYTVVPASLRLTLRTLAFRLLGCILRGTRPR